MAQCCGSKYIEFGSGSRVICTYFSVSGGLLYLSPFASAVQHIYMCGSGSRSTKRLNTDSNRIQIHNADPWQHILMRSLFNLFNVCLSQKLNIIFLVLPGKTWSEIMQNVGAFLNLHFIGRVRFQSIMEFLGIFFWWGGGGSNYTLRSSEISVDEEIG